MPADSMTIPITTATISLAILILVNVGALIWGSAVLSARMVALTDRVGDLARVVSHLTERMADQGERIAALESRDRPRRDGP